MARLRNCWVVHVPSGFVVGPNRCTDWLPTFSTKNTEIRWRVTAQSTGKKSQASIIDAWSAQELPPCPVGVSDRRRRYPQPLEDTAGRRCSPRGGRV
jgi:hypothetical protein